MRKKTLLLLCTAVVVGLTLAAKAIIFTVPVAPEFIELSTASSQTPLQYKSGCDQFDVSEPIDRNGQLNVLVWNIYKQQEDNWKAALNKLSVQSDLVLLQEASLIPELKQFVIDKSYSAELVRAFDIFDTSAGVLTLAKAPATKVCAHTAIEPWLRLPKSALLSEYRLSNGEALMVINIHAINFTLGTEDYKNQIEGLSKEVEGHQGPLIVAGDFNTWSDARLTELTKQVQLLGLQEVVFIPDERMRFITGLPLDHIFYRGLEIKEAHSIKSNASDHNPLLVSFSLKKQ
ncbi:endonuclease/exonuclease/phosphatase family protein [Aliivibrio sp. S3MY1]|uniref:endonuclease/exonuclease/phosphatase family protein n=1 Tax=unclassified Aliivibrio TaxID=2645654 RepID=UPI0023798F3E|nr:MULTISPECIES: endonuclease/exonuclease/phosphatase family protein [unclassified Aliivibrio]MDD9196229.1 endonuclease/exonuclease/phosphatase family protein [Aliivibrio sp. S3MY1]MDD9199602.1 endonuclease/exonuclease/phosphatase family protein [Aliivibrio sp. S2MY1]